MQQVTIIKCRSNKQPKRVPVVLSYDGSGRLSIVVSPHGEPEVARSWSVDLTSEVDGDYATIGFTASTGGYFGQHTITDLCFVSDDDPLSGSTHYNGNIQLGSSNTLNATIYPTPGNSGHIVGNLSYTDGTVLNVNNHNTSTADPLPLPTFADQGMWQLNALAHWMPDGSIALTTNQVAEPHRGSIFTTNLYPIAQSWQAKFGFDLGERSSTPADLVALILQSNGPESITTGPTLGFTIQWRYFDGDGDTTRLYMYTNGVKVVATNDMDPVSLRFHGHAEMDVTYDADARTVTVTTTQGEDMHSHIFTDITMEDLVTTRQAYIGFAGATGGLYAENIVSDFSFTYAQPAEQKSTLGYLAADNLSGSGTLIKRGSAALGLVGDLDKSTSDIDLQLEEGGLVLRKIHSEPLALTPGTLGNWIFSHDSLYAGDNSIKICDYQGYFAGTAMTTHRVRVDAPWSLTFSLDVGRSRSALADAFSFFLHNHPARLGLAAGAYGGAGFDGISTSFGVRWYIYQDKGQYENTMRIGRNGSWSSSSQRSYLPAIVTHDGPNHFTISYDPVAKTLSVTTTGQDGSHTNVYTDINLASDLGDSYAYLGFGSGTGGSYQDLFVKDLKMIYDDPADWTAEESYLASLTVTENSSNTITLDSTTTDGSYLIPDVTVGNGATLRADSTVKSGTLLLDGVSQSGSASYAATSGNTLVLNNLTGGGDLAKQGAGTLKLTGSAATYTGNTYLEAGTLSTDTPRLPTTTDLHLTTGATLALEFTGRQYIHSLVIDGIQQKGGIYNSENSPWITGNGELVVTYPPSGTLILLK